MLLQLLRMLFAEAGSTCNIGTAQPRLTMAHAAVVTQHGGQPSVYSSEHPGGGPLPVIIIVIIVIIIIPIITITTTLMIIMMMIITLSSS